MQNHVNISELGVHRMKNTVDKLWIRRRMQENGISSLQKLAARLGAQMNRNPLDIGAMSRRMSGHVRWTPAEASALAQIFGRPLAEVLHAVGGTPDSPATGTINEAGEVTFVHAAHQPSQRVIFNTPNGFAGATLTIEKLPHPGASEPGVYLVQPPEGKPVVRHILGQIGGQWVTSPLFGEPKIHHEKSLEFLARVVSIHFK